jgi:hypothetical protein
MPDRSRVAAFVVLVLCVVLVATLGNRSQPPARAQSPVLCPPGGASVSFPAAPFPMQPGMLAVTGFSGYAADGRIDATRPVLALVDVRSPDPVSRGRNWCAPMFHNQNAPAKEVWSAANLGQVYGVTFDNHTPSDIFVTTSTAYGTDDVALIHQEPKLPFTSDPFPDGAETVYRIDGQTGRICPMVRLSDVGTGLGTVTYDAASDSLVFSDFNTGLLYRYPTAGFDPATCAYRTPPQVRTFDHGVTARARLGLAPIADVPGDAFTPLGRRVWAVRARQGRIYYAVWWEDFTHRHPGEANEVWSVALAADGSFDATSVRREIAAVPPLSSEPFPTPAPGSYAQWSNPIASIAFSSDGRMTLAERVMLDDVGSGRRPITGYDGHTARNLEYVYAGGAWTSTASSRSLLIGTSAQPFGRNASGGVARDCDDNIWSTGHGLVNSPGETNPTFVYGLQRSPATGNGPDRATLLSTGYFVDVDGNSSRFDKVAVGALDLLLLCPAQATETHTPPPPPSNTPVPTTPAPPPTTAVPPPTTTPQPTTPAPPPTTAVPPATTAVPTSPPRPSDTPVPVPTLAMCRTTSVCRIMRDLDLVPQKDIDEALRNPQKYRGWGTTLNPNVPMGPANPPRCCLCLLNVNRHRYHPTWNPLVWYAGCPKPGQP